MARWLTAGRVGVDAVEPITAVTVVERSNDLAVALTAWAGRWGRQDWGISWLSKV